MRLAVLFFLLAGAVSLWGQDPAIGPTRVSAAIYFDKTPPLRDLIQLASKYDLAKDKRNEDLKKPRLYPYAATALPKGPDPVWQREQGKRHIANRELLKVFDGLSNDINPLDNNGAVGPNHFMQCINLEFAIYDKDNGNMVVGPVALNTLFAGIPGSQNASGDPIVLYDGQAQRWFVAEISGQPLLPPHYILVAISETSDPTGSWYRWSFLTSGFPDYPKFGITENSYLMGVNSPGDNIYAFERNVMLVGGATPQMIQFQTTQVPNSGFHVIMPMDIDGPFPPAGTPGYFVTINDDAWDGTSDQLWIYELHVDWTNPNAATFQRTQTIAVPPFDSNFGPWRENISQPNFQKLDAIPLVLMNRAPLRRFGDTLSLVCVHTVDVDNTDHAGLRWYEVTKDINISKWTIRQTGTYAPDDDSRWIASIAQNDAHEISIGYNVSSINTYPSIRYCGQSATEYAKASGNMDIAETSIYEGTVSQFNSNRWGDYTNVSVDPVDMHTFWMATSYNLTIYERGSKIAAWNFSPPGVKAGFSADPIATCLHTTVKLTDHSPGTPTAWHWTITPASFTFVNGTGQTSKTPSVRFNALGSYTVSLVVSDSITHTSDTLTRTDYITVAPVATDFTSNLQQLIAGQSVAFEVISDCDADTWAWSFPGGTPDTFFGAEPPFIAYDSVGSFDVSLTVTKDGLSFTQTKKDYIVVSPCEYCSSGFIDTTDDYISRVQLADMEHSSGSTGFEDFSSIVAHVSAGATYPIQVDITVSGGWDQYCSVWIDWDHDCQFSNNNEKIDLGHISSAQGVHTLSGHIVVPANAMPGNTRMRIIETWQDPPPDACISGIYGETEDYTVNVEVPFSVNLISFVGNNVNGQNFLRWTTSQERNLSRYVVQRSEDGNNFYPLDSVYAKGNSSSQTTRYTYTDKLPHALEYYRIKMVGNDGHQQYSQPIALILNPEAGIQANLFPNPVKDRVYLYITTPRFITDRLYITNPRGQIVQMRQVELEPGTNDIALDVSLLRPGAYFLTTEHISPIRFVKR